MCFFEGAHYGCIDGQIDHSRKLIFVSDGNEGGHYEDFGGDSHEARYHVNDAVLVPE